MYLRDKFDCFRFLISSIFCVSLVGLTHLYLPSPFFWIHLSVSERFFLDERPPSLPFLHFSSFLSRTASAWGHWVCCCLPPPIPPSPTACGTTIRVAMLTCKIVART